MLPARLEGRALRLVRGSWLGVAVALVVLVTVGFVASFREPERVAIAPLSELFTALGLSFRVMNALALVAPVVVVGLICAVVFWRRSHDPMALLFTMTLLLLYSGTSRSLLTYEGVPVLRHSYPVVLAVAFVGLILVLGLFPDGRFVPRWARWLAPAMALLMVVFPDTIWLFESLLRTEVEAVVRTRIVVSALFGVLLLGLVAQVHRYRHVSDATARQQAKWVVAPIGGMAVVSIVVFAVPAALPGIDARWVGWTVFAMVPIGILIPVAVAIAVLRYRLYEIDRIISRTVSYGLVVAVLGAVYVAGVVGLGAVVSGFAGEGGGDLVVAASVLAVVALFRPVRTRVQRAVDRRFNRTTYEARLAVEAFAQGLRDEVDLEAITRGVAETAAVAVQPAHVSVWFRGTGGVR